MKIHQYLVLLFAEIIGSILNLTFAQATFCGSVKDIASKTSLANVKIMVVTATDTNYYSPDKNGNFNFKNTAGKTKIYAISDGYVSEINSINTSNGSNNKLNISMVPTAACDVSNEKRADWSGKYSSSYITMAKTCYRSPCALPGVRPSGQNISNAGRGVLMAVELNDFARWKFAGETQSSAFKLYKLAWGFTLDTRIPVQLRLQNNTPIVDAIVDLVDSKGYVLWTARTDNTGKVELWPDAFSKKATTEPLHIEVHYAAETFTFKIDQNNSNIQSFTIDKPCSISDNLDIAFVVDATGSMSDEINYIKNDLDTFIKQIANENKDINIRLGSVFYRDFGDSYVAKYSPFSSNSHVTDNFVLDQLSGGGGDGPEAVPQALEYACDTLEWSESARAKIMFLILDAGPHSDAKSLEMINKYTAISAKKGIRIVPILCSGTSVKDAALMRTMALATNGTNIFLNNAYTGANNNLLPSGELFKIETLSELMTRITRQFSIVPECNNKMNLQVVRATDSLQYSPNPNGDADTSFKQIQNAAWKHVVDTQRIKDSTIIRNVVITHSFVKIFPNPTIGPLTIQTSADIKTMFLADIGGKILEQIHLNKEGSTEINLSMYSSGIYYLKYPTSKGWGAERFVLEK